MSDRFDFLELDSSQPLRIPKSAAPTPAPPRQPTRTQRPASTWRIVEVIGGPGSGSGQFASPSGLAVDPEGNLMVADSYNHRVQRITPSGGVSVLGKRGTRPGEFLNPQAVAWDGGHGFYVLEQGGCRVQHFGPNGEWWGEFGSRGSGHGEMLAPMAITRAPCGSLFVADGGNDRIVRWSADGLFVDYFPRTPTPGQFRPQGIAVDRAGRLWVVETPRHRVLVFDGGFRVLGARGGLGEAPGQFREPQGLAVSPSGCLLVADTGNDRVQVLDPEGAPLQAIGREEGMGAKVGPFCAPSAIALRGEDEAYIADSGNHRILRLQRRSS